MYIHVMVLHIYFDVHPHVLAFFELLLCFSLHFGGRLPGCIDIISSVAQEAVTLLQAGAKG